MAVMVLTTIAQRLTRSDTLEEPTGIPPKRTWAQRTNKPALQSQFFYSYAGRLLHVCLIISGQINIMEMMSHQGHDKQTTTIRQRRIHIYPPRAATVGATVSIRFLVSRSGSHPCVCVRVRV